MPEQQPNESAAKTDQADGDKNFYGFAQAAVNYDTLSSTPSQACANCIFFKVDGYSGEQSCHIVEGWPEPILPTGWCNRWEAKPDPQLQTPLPVVIVDVDVEVEEMALPTDGKGLVNTIRQVVKSMLNPVEPAFQVFKTKDGKKGWIARFSGKFIDREGEILADKAHDEYVERVQKGQVEPPELWMWHARGTKHGQAITVWKSGGFVLAAGLFDETDEAERAFNYYQKNRGKIKLSHMFHYPKNAKQNGVYYAYNTVEITTLPDGAEAFPYTSFEEVEAMALPDAARSMIQDALGPDAVRRAEAADNKAAGDTKTLEGQGVASKGRDNYDGATIPVSADAAALKTLQTDHEAVVKRLTEAEATLKLVADLPGALKSLQDTVKALSDQLVASQQSEAATLEKYNALEAKWLEYSALKPPATKSDETLLDDRAKTLLDTLMTQAKSESTPSLVEKMVGGQPTVS